MSGSRLHPQVHLRDDIFCTNLVLEYLVEGIGQDMIVLSWRTRDGFRHTRSFVYAKRGRRVAGSSRPQGPSDRSQMLSRDRRVCQPESWVKSHRVPGRQLQALVLAADSTTRPGTLQTRVHSKRRAPVPGVASLARTGGMSRGSRRPASPPGGTWSQRMTEDCDPKGLHSKSPCDRMRRCTGRTYQRRLSCAAAGIIGIVGPDCTVCLCSRACSACFPSPMQESRGCGMQALRPAPWAYPEDRLGEQGSGMP